MRVGSALAPARGRSRLEGQDFDPAGPEKNDGRRTLEDACKGATQMAQIAFETHVSLRHPSRRSSEAHMSWPL